MAELRIIEKPNWDTLPRMLQELCDGHPGYSVEIYAFDGWTYRQWYCKGCWMREWSRHQAALREAEVIGGQ